MGGEKQLIVDSRGTDDEKRLKILINVTEVIKKERIAWIHVDFGEILTNFHPKVEVQTTLKSEQHHTTCILEIGRRFMPFMKKRKSRPKSVVEKIMTMVNDGRNSSKLSHCQEIHSESRI